MEEPLPVAEPRPPVGFVRFQAGCIDILVATGLIWVLQLFLARWLTTGWLGFLVLLVAVASTQVVPVRRKGATLGQLMTSLRLVDFTTQGPVKPDALWRWSLMRGVVWLGVVNGEPVVTVLGLLPYIPMFNDRERRSLYDRWAGVWVLEADEAD